MYRKLPESHGNVIGYAFEGRLSEDEVKQFHDELSPEFEEHGTLRLLIRVDGLEGVKRDDAWEDLRMSPGDVDRIERFAVVADDRWEEWFTGTTDVLPEAEFFEPDQIDRAWAWLRGQDRSSEAAAS